MKKLVYILLAVFALTSCREEPDLSELSSDFLVFTNYDKSTEFSNMKNYYMPDSVLVIGNEDKAEYWTGDQAAPYLEAYEENMQSFGYTRVATKAGGGSRTADQLCSEHAVFRGVAAIPTGGTAIPATGARVIGATGATGITPIISCTAITSDRC